MAKEKSCAWSQSGVEQGAKLVVDGRDFSMQGYENGFFIGGCLFDNVTRTWTSTRRRSSARSCRSSAPRPTRRRSPRHGARIRQRHRDLHPRRRHRARLRGRINIGMVGVNVPIPVPLAYHTFGGWKKSGFGDLNQHGPDAFRFYTDQDGHRALAVRHQGRGRVRHSDHGMP
jgi:malonate-semialdehyde dehydrogenase (acetylating)/methylmalonate-semialdehyde dehydrogenase